MERGSGAALLDAGDWEGARTAFEHDLDRGETAEAHDGLGRVAWWLGRPDEAITHRERAFLLWKEEGAHDLAAIVAVWLAREHLSIYGNDAVANGWLARAERLIGDERSSARGWLELARGRRSGDAAERARGAELAYAIALERVDASLEVAALADLGLVAIERGDVAAGLDRLDEAMAAATNGEVDLLETVAETCCSLISACDLAGDAGRLAQWARIVDAFVARRGDLQFLSFCQTCNAELLKAQGRYEEAEAGFRVSAAGLRASGHRSRCVDPAVRLAEFRLLQGRFEEAGALLEGRTELPEAVMVAADLDLARGNHSLAAARLLRRVNLLGRDNLLATPLLSRLVEVQLAAGDVEAAAATASDLAATAEEAGHPLMTAHGRFATGVVAQARGRDATADLEAAAERFSRFGAKLEEGRTRLALARATQDANIAREHAGAARALFDDLGATVLADEAAALQRRLGGPARTGPKDVGELTAREQEVLRLLGEGLTNAEIAARLFISVKTAGHHVSNVLAKLHLRSRQEAAAYALRTLGRDPL